MRQNYDFGPLFGSTIGFDHMFDLLQSAARAEHQDNKYPPYDIERTGNDSYRIVMAVAGFKQNELALTAERNLLTVVGRRTGEHEGQQRDYLHRGIGARAFNQTFQLADHVKVVSAALADGLLTVELVREIPEVMRPRHIPIGDKGAEPRASQIEARAA